MHAGVAVFGLVASCGALSAQSARDSAPVPVADHHAHLKSREVAQLWFVRYPAVELPPALDRVLRDFETRWRARDHAAMAALFTEDGMMRFGDAWRRGRASLRVALLDAMSGSDLRLWAQQFGMSDSIAYIAGSYGHRTRADRADIGRLHFSLRKGTDGVWRIAVAMIESVNPTTPSDTSTIDAGKFIALLDSAGVQRAAVMSLAYQFGSPGFDVDDEQAKVRAENDWTLREAARYPDRLVAFCSVNPVETYAVEEIERCARAGGFAGLKLHFTSSFVDLRNPDHVERLRRVFRTANTFRLPIVVHMRTLDKGYGREDAEIFLRELLAEVPDVPVQIAHVAGWGGYGTETDDALGVFADAIASGDRRIANVYFDLTAVAQPGQPDSLKQVMVRRLRQLGVRRLLFGLDLVETTAQVRDRWAAFTQLPLTPAERQAIAANVAPYFRRQ
jgi:predicted TIM-barrel fold metal-dependent hydrolase